MRCRRSGTVRVAIVALAVIALAGCAPGTLTPTPTEPPPASPSPSSSPVEAGGRVIHDWAWPGPGEPFVTVNHPPTPPPLVCLRSIEASTHPEGAPAYDEMRFVFDRAFPSYDIEYVDEIVKDGSGEVVELPGARAILRVMFREAQAHDEDGASCVESSPPTAMGFPALIEYADAGDFEGVVTFALGIGSAEAAGEPRSDVRVEELERVRNGATEYVVVVKIDAEPWL